MKLTIASVFLLMLPFGCREDIPRQYQEILALPSAERGEALGAFDVNKQVEIYVIATTKFHPGLSGFDYALAENGEALLPPLLATIEAPEVGPRAVVELVGVLGIMATGSFNVATSPEALGRVEAAVRKLEGAPGGERALTRLERMKALASGRE
jgi:hypothetical protein